MGAFSLTEEEGSSYKSEAMEGGFGRAVVAKILHT